MIEMGCGRAVTTGLGTLGTAWTMSVRVITLDHPRWREGTLNLSTCEVTVGSDVFPKRKIQRICRDRKGHQDDENYGVQFARARDVPATAAELNCGYIVLLGVVAGRPRAELEPDWPEWQARRSP